LQPSIVRRVADPVQKPAVRQSLDDLRTAALGEAEMPDDLRQTAATLGGNVVEDVPLVLAQIGIVRTV
jgi:hypothetical protein